MSKLALMKEQEILNRNKEIQSVLLGLLSSITEQTNQITRINNNFNQINSHDLLHKKFSDPSSTHIIKYIKLRKYIYGKSVLCAFAYYIIPESLLKLIKNIVENKAPILLHKKINHKYIHAFYVIVYIRPRAYTYW